MSGISIFTAEGNVAMLKDDHGCAVIEVTRFVLSRQLQSVILVQGRMFFLAKGSTGTREGNVFPSNVFS